MIQLSNKIEFNKTNMFQPKLIHHCFDSLSSAGGGVRTYVESLIQMQPDNVSNFPIDCLNAVNQSHYELLHVHQEKLLWNVSSECPVVFTMHNHSAYCPSGTKYLQTSGMACDRMMSLEGCLFGHLVDGCGSRRPQKIAQNFQNAYQTLKLIKHHRVTVIAISRYMHDQLLKHGLAPEQTVTLRNGILLPQTTAEPLTKEVHQNKRILYVGRIVPYKGLDWLLKAMSHLEPGISLDIAGEGWDKPQAERLATSLGLGDRVTWHGWCTAEKLDALYQQSFTLVFPSLWHEPAGLVTLEAYARYRPVIASNLGGLPDYVNHNETGILVKANDAKALASAITELASNYSKTKQMGEQGHAYLLKEFMLEQHIQYLQRIYESAIETFQAHKASTSKVDI